MNERYTRLFSIYENLYAPGSPVIISAGALLKDNVSGNVIAQLKFKNISPKTIKALSVKITPKDTADRVCGDDIEYQYLDLHAVRDDYFGSKTPVEMPDSSIRAFNVKVSDVIFVDNEVVELLDAEWEPLPRRRDLHEDLDGNEIIKQYRINISSPNGAYIPEKVKDLWICTCGEVNKLDEPDCHSCKNNFEKELRALADKEKLTADMNARLEKEWAERDEREARERSERERLEKAEKERKEKARRQKKTLSIGGGAVIAAAAIVFLLVIPLVNYNIGVAKVEDGDYDAAFEKFRSSIFFRNKGAQLIWDNIDYNAKNISAGFDHTVGLKSDGTVVATGDNSDGQCDVDGWTDIVAVSAGNDYTIGLKPDGTVVTTIATQQSNLSDLNDWTDIVAVSAGYYHAVGLKSDGTVVATGFNLGQCDVGDWTDIVAVSPGGLHTVGLKSDSTVVAIGSNLSGQCDVGGWTDIVAVSAGDEHTVGLKSDGTVVAVGDNSDGECDVDGWTDIVAVSAGDEHTVGLKSDGTVVAIGSNLSGQCDVGDWTDIVAISAGDFHTVGLKSDGTVVAAGDNSDGQCDVDGWTDIKLPLKSQ